MTKKKAPVIRANGPEGNIPTRTDSTRNSGEKMSTVSVPTARRSRQPRSPIGVDGVVDYNLVLRSQITIDNDLEPDSLAAEMPPAVPGVDVFASTDDGSRWTVNAYIGKDTIDPADCAGIATAFIEAGRQARILSGNRAIAIPATLRPGGRSQLGVLTRGKGPRGYLRWAIEAPEFEWPNEVWGDHGWRFESFGFWERSGDVLIDGITHTILVEVTA